MNNSIKNLIKKIIQKNIKINSKYFYPLLDNAFSTEDLISGINVLISSSRTGLCLFINLFNITITHND